MPKPPKLTPEAREHAVQMVYEIRQSKFRGQPMMLRLGRKEWHCFS